MIKFLVFSFLFCTVLGNIIPKIDINNGRIIGGDLVPDSTTYPSMASLRYMNDHTCGCVIISEQYVLTAAHCVRVLITSQLSVHVGTTHVNGGGQNYEIGRVIEHPDFVIEDLTSPDIALVFLQFPFVFTSSVQPVNLPSPSQETPSGSIATLTGWGFSAEAPPINPSLLEVQMTIKDHDECAAIYGPEINISDAQICGEAPGKGTCTHDAGGPVYIDGVLHGIIARNFNGCVQPGLPDVFVRVASFRDWITENTGV